MNLRSDIFFWLPPIAIHLFLAAFAIAQIIIAIVLAVAVKRDAEQRAREQRGLFLVEPWVWFAVVALTGGYGGALGYWLIHYSRLKAQPNENA